MLFDFLKALRAPAEEKATADVPRIIFETDMIEDFKDGICYNTQSMEQRQKTRAAVGG